MSSPQYYENNLAPIPVDQEHLRSTLKQLQVAVHRGSDLVHHGVPPPTEWTNTGVYNGVAGIALAFLRLAHQATALTDDDNLLSSNFHELAKDRILPHGPDVPVRADKLSPCGAPNPLAGIVPRILEAGATGGAILPPMSMSCVRQWMWLFKLPTWSPMFDHEAQTSLDPILDSIPPLVAKIVDAGREGHDHYVQNHGTKDALPLMWPWMEGYYALGAVHGMTGILMILLACRPEELNDGASRNYLPWIAGNISALCKICIHNNGHLPMCIPALPSASERASPLVQMCHGSPGFLLFMACVLRIKALATDYWEPDWEDAIRLSSERIWEEGLLPKGGGICHGITGNAWPLLYAHDALEYEAEAIQAGRKNYIQRSQGIGVNDSRARYPPPYAATAESGSKIYRMPDRPFGLTEGLSGTICAWAETCVVIQARLRKMELDGKGNRFQEDPIFQQLQHLMLGFPALAYHRPTGLF